MSQTHPVVLGTVGGTTITADLLNKGNGTHPWDIVSVHLNSNYARTSPAGFPPLPPPGAEVKARLNGTGTIVSGATYKFHAHEAAALVAASAGTYA